MSQFYISCAACLFSGKTYISKLISERFHYERVSYDELWAKEKASTGKSVPYDILMPEAYEMLTALLRSGRSVVFDSLNDTVNNREALRDLAHKAGARSVTVYFNIPQDILLQRQAQNEQTNTRHSVPDDKMAEAFRRFEVPLKEATVLEFRPGDDLDEWIVQLGQGR